MQSDQRESIRISDFDMPFGSMVKFMVKWAIAAIPALIILMVIGALVGALLASVTAAISFRSLQKAQFAAVGSSLPSDTATMAPAPTAAPSEPTWEVSESTNPIDDSPTVILSLQASSPSGNGLRDAPSLMLRCKSRRTESYIVWNNFLGSDEVEVTTRLGRNPASTRSWSLSSDNQATFYPGSSTEFAKQLMAVDTFVARTTPYSESPVTATFTVKGLAQKIEPLRKACGW